MTDAIHALVRSPLDALRRLVRRDVFIQLGLAGVLAGVAAASLAAGGMGAARQLGSAAGLAVLALLLVALLRGRRRIVDRQERPFWTELTVAFACWGLAELLRLGIALPASPAVHRLAADAIAALAYAFLLIAVERRPHRRSRWRPTGLETMLTWPAVALFVLGLFLYFVGIPLLVDRGSYVSGAPSAGLATVLEAYLTVQLLILAADARQPRWRTIYLLLAVLAGSWLAGDLGRSLGLDAAWADWLGGPAASFGALLAVRSRRLAFVLPAGEAEKGAADRLEVTVHTVVAALAFPLLHAAGYALGLLSDASRVPRERLVFASLLLLGGIALLQHYLLRRKTAQLWRERRRVELALRKSEQDLRLMLERKTAADAIRTSKDRFAKVFRACPSSMAISRLADGRILEINEGFERMTGYAASEAIGRTSEELRIWLRPDDRSELIERLRELGTVRNQRFRFRRKDGAVRTMLMDARVIELSGERCLLSLARDVTEQQRALALVGEQAARLDQAHDAIIVLDLEDRVTYWNRGAARLYGWRVEEVLGLPLRQRLAADDEAWQRAMDAVDAKGDWIGQLDQRNRAGEALRIDGRWTLIYDEAGRPHGRLMIHTPARTAAAVRAEGGGR